MTHRVSLRVSLSRQTLDLFDSHGVLIRRYPVSTASNGAGEQRGSYQTPRGRHIVRARIGEGAPENAVFVRRRATGEIFSAELAALHPARDWILTRILWLSGCELRRNRLGEVDTMRRFIYIHGTPDSEAVGRPGSHGCIRMRNRDLLELFPLVPAYTPVEIED